MSSSPLLFLQSIIVQYSEEMCRDARIAAEALEAKYPYRDKAFIFYVDEDGHLEMEDCTVKEDALPDGSGVFLSFDRGSFETPKTIQVNAAYLKFEFWQDNLIASCNQSAKDDAEALEKGERELWIYENKIVQFAIELLQGVASAYRINPTGDLRLAGCECDLAWSAGGDLIAGEFAPPIIHLRVEEFNEAMQRLRRCVEEARRHVAVLRNIPQLPLFGKPADPGPQLAGNGNTRAEIVRSIMSGPADFRDRDKVKALAAKLDESGVPMLSFRIHTDRDKKLMTNPPKTYSEVAMDGRHRFYKRIYDSRNSPLVKDLQKTK